MLRLIEQYTRNIGFQEFDQTSMIQDACLRQLAVIGEACNRLSDGLKDTHQAVEWQKIIGLRNIVIHEYFGVDSQVIWNIITHELPGFRKEMENILSQLQS